MAKVFNRNNFNEEVLNSKEPVMVDFFASWCGPCKMLGPVIEEISEEAKGFKVGKVNIDEEPELAMKFGVMSVPTVMVFENGVPVKQSLGFKPKQALAQMIQA